MTPIKVFLADDHLIFLESMALLLEKIEGIELVGTAKDGHDVLRKIGSTDAQILICDYIMPQCDGIEVAFKLQLAYPQIKILMLTTREDTDGIKAAIQAGVKGYLSKKVTKDELKKAIYSLAANTTYYSATVMQALATKNNVAQDPITNQALTRREVEILKLIAQEMTGMAIAEKLNLSYFTVETHRKNILKKLGLNTSYALIKYAFQHHLL